MITNTHINMLDVSLWAWVIPPCCLILLSIKTRNSTLSLFGALIIASMLASTLSSTHIFQVLSQSLSATFNHNFFASSKYQIFKTMALLGIFTQILHTSGYSTSFTNAALSSLQTSKKAQLTTASFSLLFCLDDYFSILTNGAIARPMFSKFRIAKTKLAWILDSLASPVVALCPFSSWSPVILSFIIDSHLERISITPTQAYWSILPWVLYSYTTIATTFWTLSKTPSSTVFFQHASTHSASHTKNNPKPFIGVMILLITTTWVSALWIGGFFTHYTWQKAIQSTSMSRSLQYGFFCSICALLYSLQYQKKSIRKVFVQSIEKSFPGFLLTASTLTMAWTLGKIMSEYLSMEKTFALLFQHLPLEWSPCFFFMSSIFLAMTTGSSWATAALLFPTAAHAFMNAQAYPWIYPTFGAILSGSIAGDHLSPISDTTMLAAKSAQCTLYEHISTQFKQTLPNFGATFLGFYIMTWKPSLISHPQVITTLAVLFAMTIHRDIWSDTQGHFRNNRQKKRPYPATKTQQPTPSHNIQQETNSQHL